MNFNIIRAIVAAAVFSILSYAHAATSQSEMLDASVAGDEAKVLEIKSRIELGAKPARGDRKVARDLNAKGVGALNAGNYPDAVNLLKQATQTDPADSEVVTNLGYALLKANKLDEAKDTLSRALILQPGRSSPWVNLGEVLARQGNVSNATAAFNIAYLFSQNRDKTRAFFQKLIDENASPDLVTAAKLALDANGIKVVAPPSTGLQHGAKSGGGMQEIAPLSEPPIDPTPATTQPSATNAMPPVAPAIAPGEKVKASADEKTGASAVKTNGEDNESGIKNFMIAAVLTVVAWGLIFLAARAIWRRVKDIRSRSPKAVQSEMSSTGMEPSAKTKKWGTFKRVIVASVVIAIIVAVGKQYIQQEKKLEAAQTQLQPTPDLDGQMSQTQDDREASSGNVFQRLEVAAYGARDRGNPICYAMGESAITFLKVASQAVSVMQDSEPAILQATVASYDGPAREKLNDLRTAGCMN